MTNLQEIFDRIAKAKARQKEIKSMYKDALATTPEYQEINDKVKAMRERKKQIEQAITEQFGKEITELEDLKVDIESDNELLSDAALSQLVKGETVEVKDQYENQYEPVFSVKFRKIK
jgi:predicted nuclease with TOPRIM domain